MDSIGLYDLGKAVQELLEEELEPQYWVRAEIASLSVKGHCYLEMVEKTPDGELRAKMKATCWRDTYRLLSPFFEQESGMPLQVGMQVLLGVTVQMHPVYGLSLNVEDIDPSFTVGDLARQKQRTLERLRQDGVMELQAALELPMLVRRIAVISGAEAAGYGDFTDQLQHNAYGFRWKTQLFEAVVQGENAPASMIRALQTIASQAQDWDMVVIIRGGGATTDLNCFDDYALASHCAQFPLPILTGIGHTRDVSVVDQVVYRSVKTPTAAAEWLIERASVQYRQLDALEQRLRLALRSAVMREMNKLQMLEQTITLHSPERIFRLGYSLTTVNGKVVKNVKDVKPGDTLQTHLRDGVVVSEIKD